MKILSKTDAYESKFWALTQNDILDQINTYNLLNALYSQNNGFIIKHNTEDGEFVALLDLGKYYNNQNGNLENVFFENTYNKDIDAIQKYIKKEIVNVVPNTFLCITNSPFKDWFKSDALIKNILDAYPCYNLFVVTREKTNQESVVSSNNERKFDNENMFYDQISQLNLSDTISTYSIVRYPELLKVFDDYRIKTIPMILPLNNPLEQKEEFAGKGVEITLNGFETKNKLYFNSKLGSLTKALFYDKVDFNTFYNAEISLNLFNVFEGLRINNVNGKDYQSLFFYSYINDENNNTYDTSDLRESNNDVIYEDRLVSDIYTAVPIRYEDIDSLKKVCASDNNFVVNNILTGLAFQDNYEFGNDSSNIVNNAERIERIDLGSVNVTITEEPHYNYYKKTKPHIISKKPFAIRMIASVDRETHTGVLYLLNLGVKSKPTKYLNEVSCNSLFIPYDPTDKYCKNLKKNVALDDSNLVNLYSYLKSKFKIKRVGVPRHLILSPFLDGYDNNKKSVTITNTYRQIKSSLLYGESMFEEGEELGKIVDSSLNSTFKYRYGDSVYDYNTMNISKISVLQYSDTYKDYLIERIDFAVVNLFYLELLQLEESAIKIANMGISNFIKDYKLKDKSISSNTRNTASKLVLKRLEEIQEEYTKTLDFWNSQTNYYSSNEILNKIRRKFEIQKDVENLKRNHKEIQQIYDNRQQNSSNKSTLIISIVGIILTVLNILEIYSSAVTNPQESKYLTGFERFLFENLSAINVVRIALVLIIGYYFVSLFIKASFNKRKRY